jgi:polyhydroxyalkanoate synthesis regulator phasin
MTSKRYTAIGVTAGLLGGAAIGAALGSPGFSSAAGSPSAVVQQEDTGTDDTTTTTDDTTSTDDTSTDDTSTDDTSNDDTGSELTTRMSERLRDELQDLVDDGTITAEQADAVADHLVDQVERHFGDGFGDGGFGHHGGRGGPGSGGPGFGGPAFDGDVLSDLLGVEVDELRDQLRDGATIAEIAEANGVDVQGVIDALVAEAEEHLALAVENGRLTQEEADEKLADVRERITEMVEQGRPDRLADDDAED